MKDEGHRNAAEIASQPSTIEKGGGRKWIHAVRPRGKWQRLRDIATVLLLVLFYATPWLTIDGEPFIRLSFLSSSFVLFGNHILLYEFFRFVLLAMLLVFTLFIASALIGRAWCGYACPQTIFIEQVLGRIETFVEGPPLKRLAEQNKPLTFSRVVKKIIKHFLFVAVSFSFAFTLVAIFTGPQLILQGESTGALWAIVILTGLAWFDGGYWREQFCHIACPYARFQSVMQDMQTRTIGYDHQRGEPRGRQKKNQDRAVGDCIDCGLCVRVCPSGIDIRQGAAQLECTACARCVDACDSVMGSLGRSLGLIRYDALSVFEKEPTPAKSLLRPRVLAYGVLWLALVTVGSWQFIARDLHHVKLLNIKGTLPYFLEDTRVKNLVSLKVGNQASATDSYTVAIDDKQAALGFKLESPAQVGPIAPGQERVIPALISVERTHVGQTVRLLVTSEQTGKTVVVRKTIAGP